MTSWGNYFELNSYTWLDDIHREILADNYYHLKINTLLFAILIKHIEDDYIPFCIEDFESMRREFCNTGRPVVRFAFTDYDLFEFLRRFSSNDNSSCFTCLGNNQYIANMNVILSDIEFTELEKSFFDKDIRELRKFALFCILRLSLKLLDCPLTTNLLCLKKFI